MRTTVLLLLLILSIFVLSPDRGEASGCSHYSYGSYANSGYSGYYANGYSYWYGGYYRGVYYPRGWYYEPSSPYVNVATFVPVVPYPVAFSTYQSAAVTPAVQLPALATVAGVVATPAPVPAAIQPMVPAVGVPAAPVQAVADPCAARVDAAMRGYAARLDKLEAENIRLRKLVVPQEEVKPKADQPREQPKGEPQGLKPPDAARGLAVMNAHCAKCHTADTASIKVKNKKGEEVLQGKGFVLLDKGQLAPLDGRQQAALWKNLVTGRMPPEGEPELSPQEGNDMIALLEKMNVGK